MGKLGEGDGASKMVPSKGWGSNTRLVPDLGARYGKT